MNFWPMDESAWVFQFQCMKIFSNTCELIVSTVHSVLSVIFTRELRDLERKCMQDTKAKRKLNFQLRQQLTQSELSQKLEFVKLLASCRKQYFIISYAIHMLMLIATQPREILTLLVIHENFEKLGLQRKKIWDNSWTFSLIRFQRHLALSKFCPLPFWHHFWPLVFFAKGWIMK